MNVFKYLMSEVNKTRFLVQHELNDCSYRLNENVYNSRKKLNCGNDGVSVKNSCKKVLVKTVTCGILLHAIGV